MGAGAAGTVGRPVRRRGPASARQRLVSVGSGLLVARHQALLLVDEKDHRPAIEIGFELRKRAGDMPLSMLADCEDFVAKLDSHRLPGGTFY